MKNLFCCTILPLLFPLLTATASDPAAGTQTRVDELNELVIPVEKDFLLAELARVAPPERLRELSGYGQRQLELGGGFYGMLPDQLTDPDSIPLPTDAVGRLGAALCLARQRSVNLEALRQINPDYALTLPTWCRTSKTIHTFCPIWRIMGPNW